MSHALSAMHRKFSAEEDRLAREEEEINRQLTEYQRLLGMVDGRFEQVVEDWTRVQRETEECRRDLRRLGWTEG